MKNKYESIDLVKQKVSIVDVISTYIPLSKKGNNYVGICPFHIDSHPSLTVNENKKIFKCFACNTSGDVISFISKIEHIGYYEALVKLATKNNINISNFIELSKEIKKDKEYEKLYEINDKAAEYFHNFLFNKENSAAIDYLNIRKINNDLIEYFNIGFAPTNNDIMINLLSNKNNILNNDNLGFKLKDINDAGLTFINKDGEYKCIFSDRIIIPIYNINNKVVGFGGRTIIDDEAKYINTSSTSIFNKSATLYNLNNILKNNADIETIYIVEGYMDVISLHKIGINNVVATMGVAFSNEHLEMLKILQNLKVVNICFDNDEAGISSCLKAAELISKKYLTSFINYETTKKDIDELINSDKELAIKQMNNLIDLTTFKINNLIKKTNLQDVNQCRILISDTIKILKNEKDIISLNNNVLKLSDLLKIDKDIILSQLSDSKITNKSKQYNYDAIVNIVFEKEYSKKPKGFKKTDGTELEILTCIMLDRNCLTVFENKCNVLLNKENNEIFNILQEYYFNNPSMLTINTDDINTIFSNHNELIPIAMKIAINKEKIEIKTVQERLQKTLEHHLLLVKREGYKKVIDQMKNMDNEKKKQLLEKIFNK